MRRFLVKVVYGLANRQELYEFADRREALAFASECFADALLTDPATIVTGVVVAPKDPA